MPKIQQYAEFLQNELDFIKKELITARDISEVQTVSQYLTDRKKLEENKVEVRSYIYKNLRALMSCAPHLTLQVYTATFRELEEQVQIVVELEKLKMKDDIPNNAIPLVNNYISMFKLEEDSTPDMSFASDDKIIAMLDGLCQQNQISLQVMINSRLALGETIDYFVELFNPFTADANKPISSKIILLLVMLGLTSETHKSASKDWYFVFKSFSDPDKLDEYKVKLNSDYKEEDDVYMRSILYFIDSLKLNTSQQISVVSILKIYRYLNLDNQNVYETGDDIRSFIGGIMEAQLSIKISSSENWKDKFNADYDQRKPYRVGYEFARQMTAG